MLNVGKSGNQVAIIITLLEEWLNFAASGHRVVSMPYFYHGGDDDYPYGSGSGGENYYNLTEASKGSNELIGLHLLSYNETNYIPLNH